MPGAALRYILSRQPWSGSSHTQGLRLQVAKHREGARSQGDRIKVEPAQISADNEKLMRVFNTNTK
jgi:hypothetical protein